MPRPRLSQHKDRRATHRRQPDLDRPAATLAQALGEQLETEVVIDYAAIDEEPFVPMVALPAPSFPVCCTCAFFVSKP
jgi:hypothetical protein